MQHKSQLTLQFLGAAGTVTGSRYLVETNGHRILVDCGLFQGYKQLRDRNRAPFPVPPETIDAVILTHAHLDHSGYIPALIRDGFRGKVICTPATAELCSLLLRDAGYLQEEAARHAKKRGYSKHRNPLPLYTLKDAEASLDHFVINDFDREFEAGDGILARFIPAGHLLGAAQIKIQTGGKTIHFSGDLGRVRDPLMRPPRPLHEADILVCESTYGNRSHTQVDPESELTPILKRVLGGGGVVIIPAFAVGRAQGIMLHIARLQQRQDIPNVPVFLNSPMAIDATEIYHRHHDEHHVTDADCQAMYRLATRVNTPEESKNLNRRTGPMIIISASGMLTGGRVLHHLRAFAGDARNAILLGGFQAGGTRGAALVNGADHLRMFGQDVAIRAEVVQLESFSGHADANEIIDWMRHAERPPEMIYLTHGEPDGADALRFRIKHELQWEARAPEHLETIDLEEPT